MDKQQVLNQLRNAKEIYVIMSLCTKMPYVVCDKETFDDEVLLYFKEEDIRREGKRLIEEKIPVQIAKVDANQMLHFYGCKLSDGRPVYGERVPDPAFGACEPSGPE